MKDTYKNATIVDVRTPEEYAAGHYPNAVNIPLDEVAARVEEFKKMPKPVVAYCRSGNRSGMAVAILKQHGITEAVNAGGLDEVAQTLKK
ncbi:rhodanese-like domain-containing protein [Aridibaculum aurantiacum]|uniref:rhodanese-like domain-containing protein n=1 Tax=Aridibaculum aurantiacum TaxID=2810307 RepID=UPI001A97674B|nr:rhodanese-like domain-containing protein [Aridibaculum aurantiacum]